MNRESVTSTNIDEIGYDNDRRILEILFRNGSTYQYFDVPSQIFEELRSSSSLGQYINSNIKGHFRYSRI